ncbi:MAG: Xylose isomerase-like TIM barrel [Candidatus Hydrogenedentes bacterium ADurb.Bin101]|jgi:sugar phosphate isomerase/epimerase|nr:MAG: Xylose isomerase-like TIM barrel [Candidatus Hydrogenedentes bacterium ADurb.Bin101]HOC69421.1 TIM barrel protein [Candidatus Hydrogenedentota bacterium]
MSSNTYPKLHNAAWPGLVGKGEGGEPPISLEKMLDMTAAAEVDGVKFDGIDLFLSDPHISIDISADGIKALADDIAGRGLEIGSLVAPVWEGTGGGSAMDEGEGRRKFLEQVKKACGIGQQLRDLGIRPTGGIRVDSAVSPAAWAEDPEGNQKRIAQTLREACDIARSFGEVLVAEGEVCWGGMHSWKRMVQLLEMVDRKGILGFQADMAHTLLYLMGVNAQEDALLPPNFDWSDTQAFEAAYQALCNALRPWTLDFHIAQNDGTVKGSGSHDKTGRHCLPGDPGGKLDIVKCAGFWLRDKDGALTKKIRHLCWDGCMFSNETLLNQQTWNDILAAMIAVRDAHGWQE